MLYVLSRKQYEQNIYNKKHKEHGLWMDASANYARIFIYILKKTWMSTRVDKMCSYVLTAFIYSYRYLNAENAKFYSLPNEYARSHTTRRTTWGLNYEPKKELFCQPRTTSHISKIILMNLCKLVSFMLGLYLCLARLNLKHSLEKRNSLIVKRSITRYPFMTELHAFCVRVYAWWLGYYMYYICKRAYLWYKI